MACVGVLLAGGAARRFGGLPKGLATIDGVRIADRALGALREATERQLVVANDARAHTWFPGLRLVRDELPDTGPLGGITTALGAAHGAAVLVVAWDMPFVTGALLREVRRVGEEHGAQVVMPSHETPNGVQHEPLCAYYAAGMLSECRRMLAAGERRVLALLDAVGAESLGESEWRRFGEPARLFTSVDTPELLAGLGGSMPVQP